MSCHVAIITAPYDRLLIEGRKTIECRLTRTATPPLGCIVPGERVYFKRSGGPFFAAAVVDRVWMTDSLTPARIVELKKRFNAGIHGTDEYFTQRAACRFATLLWLRDVRPCVLVPRYKPQNMRAWYTLDDAADPLRGKPMPAADGAFDVVLTPGCLSQKQVRVAAHMDRFPADSMGGLTKARTGAAVVLRLEGGERIETDIVADRKMFRWRGWGAWFTLHGLGPGDRLRFTPSGARTFRVEPTRINTEAQRRREERSAK